MKVLMTTDGSVSATTGLRTASRLLMREKLLVDLLSVAALPDRAARVHGQLAEPDDDYQRRLASDGDAILAEAARLLAGESISAQKIFLFGPPAQTILDLSTSYDLTVIGAHDRYESSQPGLGHVATRVVEQSTNATLVAREIPPGRGLRVLAAVDGSLAATNALRLMANSLQLDSSEVTLIHIAETPWIHPGPVPEWDEYPSREFGAADPEGQIDREIRRESTSILESSRMMLESYGLSPQVLSTEGDTILELISEAESGEYDLIVIGSTGSEGLREAISGHVSSRVAAAAPCSVLIARFFE